MRITLTLPGKGVAQIFTGPSKPPAMPPPAPLPTPEDPSVKANAEKERLAAKRRRGIASTIKTSGLGDTSPANVRRPSVLGQTGTGYGS